MTRSARTQKKIDADLSSVEAEIARLESSGNSELAKVDEEIAMLEGSAAPAQAAPPEKTPRYGLAEAFGLMDPVKNLTMHKDVRTPEEMAASKARAEKEFLGVSRATGRSGLDEFLLNIPSQSSADYAAALERDRAEYPTASKVGSGLGFGAGLSKYTPAGAIATGGLKLGSKLPFAKIPEGAGYLRSMLGKAIESGAGSGLGAGATQSVREIPEAVYEGGFSPEQLERISSAAKGGLAIGTGAGVMQGAAERFLNPVRRFDRAIPEEADVALESAERAAGKREGLKVFEGAKEPSRTQEILDEKISGDIPTARARAKQRLKDVEDELSPIIKMADRREDLHQTGDALLKEFMNSKGVSEEIQKIRESSPGAAEQVRFALNTYFKNRPDGPAGENIVSKIFTPSEMNQKKRQIYDNLFDTDFKADTTLGAQKRVNRLIARFYKEKVEKIGDALGDAYAGKVRELNSRSGAMQNARMRMKNTTPPGFWDVAKPAIGAGVMGAGLAAYNNPVGYGTMASAGGLLGLLGGAAGYATRSPQFGTGLANLLNQANKSSAAKAGKAAGLDRNSLLRLLAAAQGDK